MAVLMTVEKEFLKRCWGAVSSDPLPPKVEQAFNTQILPMLKVTPLTDPYITDATNNLINSYFLSSAVGILQKNAMASKELEEKVNGIMKTKLLLKASTVVTITVSIVATLVVSAFVAGSTMGAIGSEWWGKKKIEEIKAEKDYKEKRLKFLENVNKDLMICKEGKVLVQENGKKACFYGDAGWFIE